MSLTASLFDEPDRFFGGYPGQLSFALFGPFLKALFHPKEINFDCRRTSLARFQFLEIGINAEREQACDGSLDPRLLISFPFRGLGGRRAGIDVPLGNDPSAGVARRHQQHLNLAVQDAIGDHTGLVKYRVRGYHRCRKLSFYGNRIRAINR